MRGEVPSIHYQAEHMLTTDMHEVPTTTTSVLIDTRIYPIAAILNLPPVRSSRDSRAALITGEIVCDRGSSTIVVT